MIIHGWDSGARTTNYLAALAADGKKFGGRYITRGDDWRTLHLPEVEAMHRHGISPVLIFQHKSDTPAYFTKANAEIDVGRATVRAQALKAPVHCAIYFAVDTDIIDATDERVLEYFSVIHAKMKDTPWFTGIYGDDRALAKVMEADFASLGYFANAKGWREAAIPDDYDILQKTQRRHPSGLDIDDCEISYDPAETTERDALASVGAWLPPQP